MIKKKKEKKKDYKRKFYYSGNDKGGEDGRTSYERRFFTPSRGGSFHGEGGLCGRGRGRVGFCSGPDLNSGSERGRGGYQHTCGYGCGKWERGTPGSSGKRGGPCACSVDATPFVVLELLLVA